MNGAVISALGKQHFVHCKLEQNYRLVIFNSDRILFLEFFLCKLIFSILLISASNIRFEKRMQYFTIKYAMSSKKIIPFNKLEIF